MHILIQSRETREYLREPGLWVLEKDEALNFESTLEAFRLCQEERLAGVQIVVAFSSDSAQDLTLPLGANCKPLLDGGLPVVRRS